MTPDELRGRRQYLVLATLLIAQQLGAIGIALSHGLSQLNWRDSLILPLLTISGYVFISEGKVWLRWVVGVSNVLSGVRDMFLGVAPWTLFPSLAGLFGPIREVDPDAVGLTALTPFALTFAFGLLEFVGGLMFLLSPSILAFFRYQRESVLPQVEPEVG
ncbi:MAG TPA: hypothetical protein VGE52_19765 [Pirellulales bacterium]